MKRAMAFLVFLLVPLGMGLFFGSYAIERMRGTFDAEDNRLLQRKLDEVVASRYAGFKISEASWRMLSETRMLTGDNFFIIRERDRAATKLDCSIRIYLIQNGRMILREGEHGDDDLILNLGNSLFLANGEFERKAAELNPAISRRWGKNSSLENFQRHNGKFLPARNPDGKPVVIFIEFRPDRLCMVAVFEGLSSELLRELEERTKKTEDSERFAGSAVPELDIWYPPPGIDRLDMEKAFSLSNLQAAPIIDQETASWAFFKDQWGKVTALCVPKSMKGSLVLALRNILIIGSIFVLFWGIQIYYKVHTGRIPLGNSIRDQLRFLFIYVSIVPLAGVLLLGWVSLKDQEDRLRHEGFRKGIERLQFVIGTYFQEKKNNLVQVRKMRDSKIFIEGSDEALASYTDLLDKRRLLDYAVVIRPGNRIFSNFGAHQSAFVQALRSLCRIGLAKFAPHRLPRENQEPLNPLEMLADDMIQSDEMGWSDLVQYRDRLHELRIARSTVDLYWDVYPDTATGTLFLGLVQEHSKKLLEFFSRKIETLKPEREIFFIDLKAGDIFPASITTDIGKISDLLVLSTKKNAVIEREVDLSAGTAWMVAMPDSFSSQLNFLAIDYAERSLSQLRPLKIGLFVIFVLSILVSLFAGSLLTSTILAPIQDLSEGMNAIRKRQTEFRVPIRRQDEFGRLAALFNRMLSEFRELELGRIVQAQLLPRQIPEIPGYSVGAKNLPATDLGGDYYDILPLPDGKFLLLMGDATGHGVSAALAMAMAKAIVAYQLSEGNYTPEKMLEALNFVFFNELKAMRKFMTLLLVILDPKAHSVEFWNAGHNFPILCTCNGDITCPDMPSFPIGMKREYFRATKRYDLGNKDVMVIFTDGFTETESKNGGFIGYDGLNEIIKEGAGKSSCASEILNHCFKVLMETRKPVPLNDDITLVVVRREC